MDTCRTFTHRRPTEFSVAPPRPLRPCACSMWLFVRDNGSWSRLDLPGTEWSWKEALIRPERPILLPSEEGRAAGSAIPGSPSSASTGGRFRRIRRPGNHSSVDGACMSKAFLSDSKLGSPRAAAGHLLAAPPIKWGNNRREVSSPKARRASARVSDREDILAGLSEQQRAVARLVTQGLTNPEIAQRLHLSPNTVRNYLSRVMVRLAGIIHGTGRLRSEIREKALLAGETALVECSSDPTRRALPR